MTPTLRRLSWAFALALIIFLSWRDLAGIGAALASLNADRLAENGIYPYAKIIQFALKLESERDHDFVLAVTGEPNPTGAATLNAVLLYNLALSDWQQNDKAAALAFQRQAVQNNPDRSEFQFNLGLMLAETGQSAAAQAALREATLLAPQWAEAQLHLSAAALAGGEFALAEKAARRALNLTPGNLTAAQALARALVQQEDDAEEHVATIAELTARFPHDSMLRLYHAVQLRNAGQRQASTDLLLNLLRTNQDEALRERLKAELALNAR